MNQKNSRFSKQREKQELGMEKKERYGIGGVQDLPGVQETFMELVGNRKLEIDGCKGILEYTMEVVRVRTNRLVVKISGRNLLIRCMTRDSICVEGYISNIEFIGR